MLDFRLCNGSLPYRRAESAIPDQAHIRVLSACRSLNPRACPDCVVRGQPAPPALGRRGRRAKLAEEQPPSTVHSVISTFHLSDRRTAIQQLRSR